MLSLNVEFKIDVKFKSRVKLIFKLISDSHPKSRRCFNFYRYIDCLSVVQLYINAVKEICIMKAQPLVVSNRYWILRCKTHCNLVFCCFVFCLYLISTFYFSLSFYFRVDFCKF